MDLFLDIMFLQADGGGGDGGEAGQGDGGFSMLLMFGAIIVVFYFFMIRPQQKKQKQEKLFRENLGKGDRVMTIGGIYGRILSANADDPHLMVEIDNGVKIKVEKSAVKPLPQETDDKKK